MAPFVQARYIARVSMNWKMKALAQSALSRVPFATTINYWGQTFITHAHDDLTPLVLERIKAARWFLQSFRDHSEADLATAQFFEFGAGWDLAGPLALYCLGVNFQNVVDITVCVRTKLINRAIEILNRIETDLPRRPGAPIRSLDDLRARFGIRYEAPMDARATRFPTESIDCVTSTYTMEHIPQADLRAILKECRRIIKPGGLVLSIIDYQDHYSYRDSSISVYNFLQYTDRQWRPFNSSLHYQNRMRHSQYRRLFEEANLRIDSEELVQPRPDQLERLQALRLAPTFQQFTADDLMVLGSKVVAQPEAESRARSEVARAPEAVKSRV